MHMTTCQVLVLGPKTRGVTERSVARKVKARREGAGQAGAAARRALPAHGGHAASAP